MQRSGVPLIQIKRDFSRRFLPVVNETIEEFVEFRLWPDAAV
jgi:hypothetical protein